ncbi:MAG: S8 family serine peptidase [Nitrospirota bacterium]
MDHSADVINLSLATSEPADGKSALSQASDNAVKKGVIVVAAAGNDGPIYSSITPPGDARYVITVGAIDKNNVIADFSSRGPTADGRTKPDVVAPGVDITSCVLDSSFGTKSGTSMSTPHVSGVAALLVQAYHPKPQQAKEAIMKSAVDLGYETNTQGAGKIDGYGAYQYLSEILQATTQILYPGDTAIINYTITNLGNVDDTFKVQFDADDINGRFEAYPTSIQDDWVSIIDLVSSTPGKEADEKADIAIPIDWAGMENTMYSFSISATSIVDEDATDYDVGCIQVLATKRSMVQYIKLEIEWLISDVEGLNINQGIKNSLLSKLNNALAKCEQALQDVIGGEEKQANNMLNTTSNMLNAFVNEVEAQSGKKITVEVADDLISKAQKTRDHITTAIETPLKLRGTKVSESVPGRKVDEPKVSKLLQNYPNPVKEGTWIPYQLAVDSVQCSVKIYNITGQLVRTIEVGKRKAGFYTQTEDGRAIYWDRRNDQGKKVAAGLYFYQLKADQFTQTKRMLVIR